MPLEIDQQIIRRNDADFKLLDDRDITGGLHTVASVAERNQILPNQRKVGMLVAVQATNTMYQLAPDLIIWNVFSAGAGGAVISVTGNDPIWVDNTDPTNPVVGPAASPTDGSVIISSGSLFEQRRLTSDDIDPPWVITGLSPTVVPIDRELGAPIINPQFNASYMSPPFLATFQDPTDTQPVPTPTLFGYGPPNNTFAARSYLSTLVVNQGVTWILRAKLTATSPLKQLSISANIGLTRAFFGASVQPGVFDETFIEGLTGVFGGRIQTGYGSNTYAFSAPPPGQHLYICIPTAWGSPSSWKDQNNDAFIMTGAAPVATVAVSNAFVPIPGGYKVWESANEITAAFTITAVP